MTIAVSSVSLPFTTVSMVFSHEDKIIIKNDIEEFGLNAYQIWKKHSGKGWKYCSVKRLLKRFKEDKTMDRAKGSGRPRTARTEENEAIVEELICSQEEQPHTHQAPRQIEKNEGISRSAVVRIVNDKGINNFKRCKTTSMNEGTRSRRVNRAVGLIKKFEKNPRMIEKTVWQDEKDFSLHVPVNTQNDRVYYQGKKSDVPDANLNKETKRMSKKVMVSAGLCYHGATKPFFVNDKGLKVNAINYHKHLQNELFPAIEKVTPRKDWIFAQDGATSHTSNLVQNHLANVMKKRFIAKTGWPPSSPDVNPLDYFFWDFVKMKVYANRNGEPFKNEIELKRRITSVWNECATDLVPIRKAIRQFVPRLKAVERKCGYSIKMLYG